MSLINQSLSIEPRIQDSILFDVNNQTLHQTNLTEHICRLQQMSRFLTDAINKNRINLSQLREVVKNQISTLKTSYSILQNNTKEEIQRLKSIFEPAIVSEVKKINELKADVSKITSQQLTTKKTILNVQAAISHCQTEIGFTELTRKHQSN